MTQIDPSETIVTEVFNPTHGTLICYAANGKGLYLKPEDEIDTAAVLSAQASAMRGSSVDIKLLTEKMAIALCTVDGEPITIDMLNGKPKANPKAIGWRAYAKLQNKVTEINKDMPSLGNSLESGEN